MTEHQISQFEAVSDTAEPAGVWRNEVQDRLARYKRRRGRRIEGAYTMRFPFPVDEAPEADIGPQSVPPAAPYPLECVAEPEVSPAEATIADDIYVPEPGVHVATELVEQLIAEMPTQTSEGFFENVEFALEPPLSEEEPVPFVETVLRPRPKRKVIAFPRQPSVAPEVTFRLADPVMAEVPRILDVPEELEATPFLDGLQLDLPRSEQVERQHEHVELPFQPVRISRRLLAGIVDIGVVAAGVVAFAAVAYKTLANPSITKPLALGVAAAAVVLWSAYQYLFIVHAGKTLGMLAARVRLRTFKGKIPTLRQRRNRVLGFYLSALSLSMGLMWALVDVDGLCWHDRLSHTYLCEPD